jgi:hypothetical protein
VSNDFDATARHCWAMAQRVGMQIAELPLKVRERAFAGAETCLRAAGSELGVAGQQLESLVDLQMRAIRQTVTELDVSGSPRHERLKNRSATPNVIRERDVEIARRAAVTSKRASPAPGR